ncbi:MAG: Holliday junction resolvase RuvX [Pseudomonadota bacterium]
MPEPQDSEAGASATGGAALTVLAFDFGSRWIGVASGQSITGQGTRVTTLTARRGQADRTQLQTLIDDYRPDVLVVGLPLNMDGTESAMSTRARRFARYLEKTFDVPTALADERLTSREGGDHEGAAVLIAQAYLAGATTHSD